MIKNQKAIYAILFGIATVASGLFVGRAAGRWGAATTVTSAQQLFAQQLPDNAGNWHKIKQQVLEPDVLKMMQCDEYIARVYENVQTGDRVTVAVLLGPAGPISVHSPEICYSSRDFTVSKTRTKIVIEDSSRKSHEFWDVLLKSHDSAISSQRVLYAWSIGGPWEATASPRFAYAGAPYLYKLQLAAGSRRTAASGEFDPSEDFLRSFLTQCQSHMVAASK
jgi:hypothetical protein